MMGGWKTMLWNGANMLVAIFAVLMLFDWTTVLPAREAGLVFLAIKVVDVILRFMTTTPVGVPARPPKTTD